MLSLFPRGVLDEILNLIESVFKGFPSYPLIVMAILVMTVADILDGQLVKKVT